MRYLLVLITVLAFFACNEKQTPMETPNTTTHWAFPYFEKVDSLNPILKPSPNLTFTDPITQTEVKIGRAHV